MHIVLLQQIMPQYYAYARHAHKEENIGKPIWELAIVDQGEFEDKWFTQQGIKIIRSTVDGKKVSALGFESEGHFLLWMLRWT